jgi:hypothetical protein
LKQLFPKEAVSEEVPIGTIPPELLEMLEQMVVEPLGTQMVEHPEVDWVVQLPK